MKTRVEITLIALMSTLFAACCTIGQPDTECSGDTATIKYGPGMLLVSPECLEVEAGDAVTLKLEGPPLERGQAQTRRDRNKDSREGWLDEDNTDQRDRIVINVPPIGGEGGTSPCGKDYCDFKYEIVIEGVGVLDPRIRVNY